MGCQTWGTAVLTLPEMVSKLTILGCGSAIPTATNNPSGQILEMSDKQFMIDCGEGVQNTIRQMMLRTARLYCIFISHLHGDHCFGLLGLISTWAMMNRTQDLHIFAHKDLERLMQPLLEYHCSGIPFQIIFHNIDPRKKAVIWEDRTVMVSTIPLRHSVPTCGFLFEEKPHRHPTKLFRYAYCSDTGYKPAIVPQIKGVDVLYHETTYLEELKESAKRYQHSTAKQAAKIAQKAEVGQLIIGHFSARVTNQELFLQEAKEVFDNVILAKDRMVLEFRL